MSQYEICRASSPKGLEDKVNKLIAKGFEPMGGLVIQLMESWWYYQTMYKVVTPF